MSASRQTGRIGRLRHRTAALLAVILVVVFLGCSLNISPLAAYGATSSTGDGVEMRLLTADSMVASDSGYHATIAITNSSSTDITDASLSVFIGGSSIIAATQMQSWADGDADLPTRTQLIPQENLAKLDFPRNATTNVTLTIPKDSRGLSAISSWGAKPVRFRLLWGSGKEQTSELRTFFTRTTDGLNVEKTPAMSIVPMMTMTENSWEQNQSAIDTLLTTGFTSDSQSDSVNQSTPEETPTEAQTPSDLNWRSQSTPVLTKSQTQDLISTQLTIADDFPQMQVIAEPHVLGSDRSAQTTLTTAGVTQPYDFDITGYADLSNLDWLKTDIDETMMSAQSSQAALTTAQGEDSAGTGSPAGASTIPIPIALEGSAAWDQRSLDLAHRLGYSVVIGNADMATSTTHAVLTGRQVVPTATGSTTMLLTEPVLSTLAQGKPSDMKAVGENSPAGRISRFIAQSAVYQMQRPYVSRTLLVSFGEGTDTASVDGIMSALAEAPWLQFSNLASLVSPSKTPADMQPDTLGQYLNDGIPFPLDGHQTPEAVKNRYDTSVKTLSSNAQAIHDFESNTLDTSEPDSKDDADNPQSLALQNANTDSTSISAEEWVTQLSHTHALLAFIALSSLKNSSSALAESADSRIVHQLHDGITVVPPQSVNVMSQTASLPVNVENRLPFAVTVKIFSATDSNAITTTASRTVSVPANSQVQSTLTISVVGSSSAQAEISLADRASNIFSSAKTTQITAHLAFVDTSGNIILAIAGLLAVGGIYRQITRKRRKEREGAHTDERGTRQ